MKYLAAPQVCPLCVVPNNAIALMKAHLWDQLCIMVFFFHLSGQLTAYCTGRKVISQVDSLTVSTYELVHISGSINLTLTLYCFDFGDQI